MKGPSVNDPERYHLTLALDGRAALEGWWGREETARRKFKAIVGEYGVEGATVTLTDTATGDQVASWPDSA